MEIGVDERRQYFFTLSEAVHLKTLLLLLITLITAGQITLAQETIKKPKLGTVEDGQKALAALNGILSAYADGDAATLRQSLDLKMIGFQKFLDNAVEESASCKQMKFTLQDTQVQAGPDLVVVQSRWEKRCLLLPNMIPQYSKGHATFLLQSAEGGTWNMTGVSGDTPLRVTSGIGQRAIGQ